MSISLSPVTAVTDDIQSPYRFVLVRSKVIEMATMQNKTHPGTPQQVRSWTKGLDNSITNVYALTAFKMIANL